MNFIDKKKLNNGKFKQN